MMLFSAHPNTGVCLSCCLRGLLVPMCLVHPKTSINNKNVSRVREQTKRGSEVFSLHTSGWAFFLGPGGAQVGVVPKVPWEGPGEGQPALERP